MERFSDYIVKTVEEVDLQDITTAQYIDGVIWSFPSYMGQKLMHGSSVCLKAKGADGWTYPKELEPYIMKHSNEVYKWKEDEEEFEFTLE